MAEPSCSAATPADEAAIRALLQSAGLPTADLRPDVLARFLVLRDGGEWLGCVGLESEGRHGLLRSLAVAAAARGRGHGERLLLAAEQAAREAGIGDLYLLTPSAAEWFARHGYTALRRADAPPQIATHPQFVGLCPASAALMHKSLASA